MEIKVGEYIRTKDGVIAKVTYVDIMMVDCDRDVFDLNNLAMMEIPTEYIEEYIVKHSSNIIDLIEEGDYVKGLRIANNVDGVLFLSKVNNQILNEPIQNIVTTEQFNQMKYIVGGE